MKSPLKPSVLGLLLLAPLSALPVGAQLAPLGPETVVVSDGRNIDYCSQLIGHADRSFTLVWTERPGGEAFALRAQRFDGTGTRVGEPIRVDAGSRVARVLISTAAQGRGALGDIVVWLSYLDTPEHTASFFEERVLSAGAPSTVTTPAFVDRLFPRPVGGYLGTWPSTRGTSCELFDAAGHPASPVVRLNGTYVSVAQALDGSFAVASASDLIPGQLVVQRFGASARPLGAPVTLTGVAEAHIASAPDGRTALSWVDYGPYTRPSSTVRLQFFNPNGTPAGSVQEVATPSAEVVNAPAIAMDRSGRALLVWYSYASAAASVVQLWSPAGAASPLLDLAASPIELGRGSFCASAAAAGRDWVVAWWGLLPTGEPAIFVRRFSS
jgi:hypothetical protein